MDFFAACSVSRFVMLFVLSLCTFSAMPAHAADIYKCIVNGKPVFTSKPMTAADCQPMKLMNVDPSPADIERAIAEKQRRAEEDQAAQEKAQENALRDAERRAAEREAEAAMRRARVAEEELRLLKERERQGIVDDQTYFPGGVFVPFPHPFPPHRDGKFPPDGGRGRDGRHGHGDRHGPDRSAKPLQPTPPGGISVKQR